MNKKIRVGLVYGGRSGEHDVSLSTALAVIKAFDHSKYEVHPFYITRDGEWQSGPALTGPVENIRSLTFSDFNGEAMEPLPSGSDAQSALAPLFANSKSVRVCAADAPDAPVQGADSDDSRTLDVILPLLHGTYGEDGTIQGLCEMANIPYVGAGVLASAVGMDKVMMKKVFAQEGLPQCLFRHFTRTQWQKEQDYHLMEIEVSLGYPCFVKPANLGSSVGISKARNRQELIRSIDLAFEYDRKVIIEEFVNAREIEVGVLGNEEPQASVPGEVVSSNEFYDYKAKYIDGKSAMIIPADIPPDTAEQIREMAVQAFLSIDGTGLSRVDFFLGRDDDKIYINEINTMPGFTPFSMYPLLWKETGKPYGELLDDLLNLAIERFESKQNIRYLFEAE